MAVRPTCEKTDGSDTPTQKRILKRTKVLTTEMADDAPVVKRGVVKKSVEKKSVRTKPVARKAAPKKPAVKTDVEDRPHSTSIWNDPRDPRPERRSATERLDDPPPADGPLLVARVANAIERELTQIEIIVGQNRVPPRERSEAERRARTLASLARTLSLVTQLREKNLPRPDDDDADAMPRDLDEFRDALARRLEGLLAEKPQPADGESDTG